ncbi:S8 family serine peptidase, partial [Iamia sp.]|uniref:S8 family serine peptidase n=1 Tax=Iamia sp. TaxID=2722710 RepID=UPI002BC6B8E2
NRRRVAMVVVVAGLVAGLAAATPATAQVRGKGGGSASPLSVRLETLADQRAGASTAAQNRVVDLPTDGAGSLLRDDTGRLLVDIWVDSPAVLAGPGLSATGAVVTAVDPSRTLATVAVDPPDLDGLTGVDGLRSAREIQEPIVGGNTNGTPEASSPDGGPVTSSCADRQTSEADTQLRAALARSTHGVSGAGIKIGILSDSFASTAGGPAADVAAGELPGAGNPCGKTTPVQVLTDISGGIDEGRAMAQLIHDLAPDAELLVASAFNGDVDFANQIRALRTAGATVIVDDITYFSEPMYQDGVIAKAVNDVTASGAVYFSSAANSHATVGGTPIGSYEATSYRPASCPAAVADASCHDFDPGVGVDSTNRVTVPNGQRVHLSMGYSEPLFGVSTDLEIRLLSSSGAVVAESLESNPSTGSTFEFLNFTNSTGTSQSYDLVVSRFSGANTPRFKVIFHRARFAAMEHTATTGGNIVGPTTFGHNAARSGAAVAATPWFDSNTIESFSSRGPATYCWNPVNGTTPATAITPCATKQIDFSASDGTVTTVAGFEDFFGTSAAAPHAAAVAALQREAEPCRTGPEVMAALRTSGRPIAGFGADAQGSGLIDAVTAISGLGSCPAGAGQSYSSITPCRVVDTRASGAGGAFTAGQQRSFQVAGTGPGFAAQGGTAGGCTIPTGAVAVEASITAVGPTGTGYTRAWPAGTPLPGATFLNYPTGTSITNTGTIPITTTAAISDMAVQTFGAGTHIVIDIQGYFFPAA